MAVVLRGARLADLQQLDCCRGLDTGVIALVKQKQGGSRGAIGGSLLETYENIFIRHNFLQFGKQHSWYKPVLSSIVLSQQCCAVYFITLTIANP